MLYVFCGNVPFVHEVDALAVGLSEGLCLGAEDAALGPNRGQRRQNAGATAVLSESSVLR
jgi:hypothetical protein